MFRQIITLVSLFSASVFICIGHGGLSALMLQLGKREYDFSDSFLGLLVSVMYGGFIVGNYVLRYLLPRVSYIRTFSICAALTAIMALLLPVLPVEMGWIVLRFAHGLFFSTTVVICDGWLNAVATPENRSRLMAAYMSFNFIAFGFSQYILLAGDAFGTVAFSFVSIFIIFSLIPICMTRLPEPQSAVDDESQHDGAMTMTDAYRVAPIAMLGQFTAGVLSGGAWLFIRYAESITDNIEDVSILSMVIFGSGFLLQYPIGWLSDRVKDRRTVMIGVYGITAVLAFILFFGHYFSFWGVLFLVLLYGSFSTVPYALNIVYGQDFVGKARAAEYVGRLFQVYSLGALVGPVVIGSLMESLSVSWLFGVCALVLVAMTSLSITDRLMPRFIPLRPAEFTLGTGVMPTLFDDKPVYNETDIGPVLHDNVEIEATYSEADIGPILPDDSAINPSDEEKKQQNLSDNIG